MKMDKLAAFYAIFAFALMVAPALNAQQPQKSQIPTAPVPVQIISSNKVFISNAGVDGTTLAAVTKAGDPDQPYDEFYAAMKTWGRYELAAAPVDADLVFEIRFTAPMTDCGKAPSYAPQLSLAILDAKTHFRLWTFTAAVQGAIREATWKKNFSQGITDLVDDLKKLTTQTVMAAEPRTKSEP